MKYANGASAIRAALLANMRSGHWRAGEKLPTERALSETYQIGRAAVRQILAEAKERGLITQTVGSGTFVSKEAGTLLEIHTVEPLPERSIGVVSADAQSLSLAAALFVGELSDHLVDSV